MEQSLHIVVFPWLAKGHVIPFFTLSKRFAQNGHKVSFLSTPKNLLRLPKIPPLLSPLLTLIPLPLPEIPKLPPNAECSSDVPYSAQPLLKRAFDLLQPSIVEFLEASSPDWIVYDYASHWLPKRAAALGISRAFFSLFTAACLDFTGPPEILISGGDSRSTPEKFAAVPEWIPFETSLRFAIHTVSKYTENVEQIAGDEISGDPDTVRFAMSAAGSDVVGVRSRREFEPEWFDLLGELYKSPVIPLGFLPPEEQDLEDSDDWIGIKDWLDKKRVKSVVYVAFGTEASLTQDELTELAMGLERSELEFFWVLRDSPGSGRTAREMLPDGFVDRVRGRGRVHVGWAPQVRVLSHDSVGAFVTHCGWNSVVEGLGFGRPLVLLPLLNEQGLNAKLLVEKGVGFEIPRDELDGSFMADSVADSVRMAMMGNSGESLRVKAEQMRELFGDREGNERCLKEFMGFLVETRK